MSDLRDATRIIRSSSAVFRLTSRDWRRAVREALRRMLDDRWTFQATIRRRRCQPILIPNAWHRTLKLCLSIGATDSCVSEDGLIDSMFRRLVSCQEAIVSDVGAPLDSTRSRLRIHRSKKVGRNGLFGSIPATDFRQRSGRRCRLWLDVIVTSLAQRVTWWTTWY